MNDKIKQAFRKLKLNTELPLDLTIESKLYNPEVASKITKDAKEIMDEMLKKLEEK